MARDCNFYRDQAMIDGLNSPAAARWRQHSHSCHGCKIEIQLLETMQGQASDSRQHLSSENYALLINNIKKLSQQKAQKKWHSKFWQFCLKTAAAAAVVILMLKFVSPTLYVAAKNHLEAEKNSAEKQINLFLSPAERILQEEAKIITDNFFTKAEIDELFKSFSGTELEQDIQYLRSSVSEYVSAFSYLLNQELNGDF